jgi:Ser/Thr protein kinase RdoA (MazF antagonist)
MTPGPLDEELLEWSDGTDPSVLPEVVRRAFSQLDGPIELRSLSGGLLHRSFHVRVGEVEYVLQRVSDVFAPEIHDNIQAVTAHLASRHFPTAPLLPTLDGRSSADLGEQGRWRLMPHLGGISFRHLQSIAQAESAGTLVGRFHAALRDFDAPLAPMGIPYRDTPLYLNAMRRALETHREHRLAAEMTPLGERVLAAFEELGRPVEVESRVIHGDLKLENLLFESRQEPGRDRALALIDLDTLMRAPLWVELGDAWRSWCNPAGEDTRATRFEMSFFEASTRGFLEGYDAPLSEPERISLATAIERVTLELCARYVTDALEECYFGWDDSSFPGRGEHNAVRAFGQWRFYESTCECRGTRESILASCA